MLVVHWLTVLPPWLSFVIIVAVFLAYAYIGTRVARAWLARAGVTHNQVIIASWMTAFGALTSLIYAFMIITLWNRMYTTQRNVDELAQTMHAISMEVPFTQRPLVREFAQALQKTEYPRLCSGRQSHKVTALESVLASRLIPRTAGDGANLHRDLARLVALRVMIIRSSRSAVPSELWFTVILISLVTLSVTFLANHEHVGFHFALVVLFAIVLASVFWISTQFDYPFCGGVSVSTDALVHLSKTIRR